MKKQLLFTTLMAVILFTACDLLEESEKPVMEEVSSNITTPTTWKENNTYIIVGNVVVSANLTIEPGATIKFKQGATLKVSYYGDEYARIIANGTSEKPIRFTSDSPNPMAGNWGYIGLYQGASGSEFTYCIFEYCGAESSYGGIYLSETSAKFCNCEFRNIKNNAIKLDGTSYFTEFRNNSFSAIEKHAIDINANAVHTIGANNSFSLNSGYGIRITDDLDQSGDYTWLAHSAPYIIDDVIRIGGTGNGVNLTIEPGTVFRFTQDKRIDFSYWGDHFAKITAVGTQQSPIIFTSNNPAPQAGNYQGLRFYNGSNNSVFEHCIFEYAASESNYGGIYIEETNVQFNSCQFRNMKYVALKVTGTGYFTSFANNTFENNQSHPIDISANYVRTIGAGNVFNSGAYGIVVRGDLFLEGSHLWRKHDAPYIIDDVININSGGNGVTLTIAPGTTVKFNLDKTFRVAYYNFGKIIANGTAQEPIIFTSSKSTPAKGDWRGLYFYSGANGSSFQYCQILYAGREPSYGAFALFDTGHNTITLDNCRIAYSLGHGITYDDNSSVNISTVTFDNNNGSNYYKR